VASKGIALLMTGIVVLAGCSAPASTTDPTNAPTASPAASASVDPSLAPGEWRTWAMPNLALEIDLPPSYVNQVELPADVIEAMAGLDRNVATDTQRAINESIRLKPGGDMGLRAIDPMKLTQVRVRYDAVASAETDLFAYLARTNLANVDPELTSANILGQDAPVIDGLVDAYSPPKRSVTTVLRVPQQRVVEILVFGPGDAFDRDDAISIMSTIRESAGPPLGEPYVPVEDPALLTVLSRLPDVTIAFAGDHRMMEFYGESEAALFRLARNRMIELQANPDRLRGAAVAMSGGSSVWAVRINGDPDPDWSTVVDGFAGLGLERREDLGEAVYAAASGEGSQRVVVAVMPRGELFFQLLAPSDQGLERLIGAIDSL
jgi:hypothetical protein